MGMATQSSWAWQHKVIIRELSHEGLSMTTGAGMCLTFYKTSGKEEQSVGECAA
jgi:hypothetical protein